jgi:hypothetical protein
VFAIDDRGKIIGLYATAPTRRRSAQRSHGSATGRMS